MLTDEQKVLVARIDESVLTAKVPAPMEILITITSTTSVVQLVTLLKLDKHSAVQIRIVSLGAHGVQ